MSFFPLPPLVSTVWLAERLGEPELVILDTSWYVPTYGRNAVAEYREGHIPGARYFDLDRASDQATSLPHMVPDAALFSAYVGGLGVGDHSVVVAYDGSGSNMSAARVWWMFRAFGHPAVAVLDGGMGKWKREGRPTEGGEIRVTPATLQARLDRSGVKDLDDVRQSLATGSAQVVDLRAAGRFTGADPEPRPGIPSGHIPGSVNLPHTELVRPDGTVLSDAELRVRLERAGIRLDRPVVASCGSGTSACALVLALHCLGHDSAFLYDGSWTEWARRGMPVALGES